MAFISDGAAVDRRASAGGVPGGMGRGVQFARLHREVGGIGGAIAGERDAAPLLAGGAFEHRGAARNRAAIRGWRKPPYREFVTDIRYGGSNPM